MAITTVLFDLDGTLLPMDQDVFVKAYFGGLAKKAALHGYEPRQLMDSIWGGTAAMVKNDGSASNEVVFWNFFTKIYGEAAREDVRLFEDFYRQEFQAVREVCGLQPRVPELLAMLKAKGLRVALATNPIFPRIATESRIRWAGAEPEDFCYFTSYENSCHSKPNPVYYRDVLDALGVAPEECIMVGNDVDEDMVAAQLGIRVFLLTDCLINKSGKDIGRYPNGDFQALMDFLAKQ